MSRADAANEVAMALLKIAGELKSIGLGNACTEMGALELIGVTHKEVGSSIASGIDRHGEEVGGGLGDVSRALSEVAVEISKGSHSISHGLLAIARAIEARAKIIEPEVQGEVF